MTPLLGLLLGLGLGQLVLVVVALVIAKGSLPKGPKLNLERWPSPVWLYTQVLFVLRKPKTTKAPRLKEPIEVCLSTPTPFSKPTLSAFLTLAGYPKSLTTGVISEVPLMYPIVESFRLCMQAMLLPQFPFNVLGSVLGRNCSVLHRALAADERLVYSCQIEPELRVTPKGHTEVDLVTLGRSSRDDSLVWSNTLTVIIISKGKRGGSGSSEKAGQQAPVAEVAGEERSAGSSVKREQIEVWWLPKDTGRRYGFLNADLNPIHLHPLTSQLFGFKRPIAHALFLTARAEAALASKGIQPQYPAVLEAEFKRPTLLPAKLQCTWEPSPDPAAALRSGSGIKFAVLTEDGAKEVLTGRMSCKAA